MLNQKQQHHTEISALTEWYLKTRKITFERGTNRVLKPWFGRYPKERYCIYFKILKEISQNFTWEIPWWCFGLYFPALLFEIDEEKWNGEVDREKQDKTYQSLFFYSPIREEDNISKANLFSCNSLGLHFTNIFYRKLPFWGTQCLPL